MDEHSDPQAGTQPSVAWLGIVAVFISLVGTVLFLVVYVAPIAQHSFNGDVILESLFGSPNSLACGSILTGMVGFCFGIASIAQKEKKYLGIIALVISLLPACSCATLSLIAMSQF